MFPKEHGLLLWEQWEHLAFARVRMGSVRPSATPGTRRVERTGANLSEHPPRLDKLGVTGSSPVPPTSEKSQKSC